MELTMATRKAITRGLAVRYRDGSRTLKGDILDTVCGVSGYHRDYARRALRLALKPRVVTARVARAPTYDATVVAALEKCWAVLNAPAGKRLAPMLAELVPLLRRYRELDLDEERRSRSFMTGLGLILGGLTPRGGLVTEAPLSLVVVCVALHGNGFRWYLCR